MRSCLPLNTPARSLAETIQVQSVGKERTQAGTQARPHTSRKRRKNSYLPSSRCVGVGASAMRFPRWRAELMSQVLRTQLTHGQTLSHAHRERAGGEEDVSDGQGEAG